MNGLKSSEAYQYLHSNKLRRILLMDVGHNLVYLLYILKADVEPSQSLNVPHHVKHQVKYRQQAAHVMQDHTCIFKVEPLQNEVNLIFTVHYAQY